MQTSHSGRTYVVDSTRLLMVWMSTAVARAGIRILSASHNADSELSGNAEELDERLDMPQDVQSQGVLDEEEMYARAMWAREEMRLSTVNRKQNGEYDEEDEDNVDYGDEDTDDTDDTEGFEGAREVGFEAPPKGFKAEVCFVSLLGSRFISVLAVCFDCFGVISNLLFFF